MLEGLQTGAGLPKGGQRVGWARQLGRQVGRVRVAAGRLREYVTLLGLNGQSKSRLAGRLCAKNKDKQVAKSTPLDK